MIDIKANVKKTEETNKVINSAQQEKLQLEAEIRDKQSNLSALKTEHELQTKKLEELNTNLLHQKQIAQKSSEQNQAELTQKVTIFSLPVLIHLGF